MLDTIIDVARFLGKDGNIKVTIARCREQVVMCDVGSSDFRNLVF